MKRFKLPFILVLLFSISPDVMSVDVDVDIEIYPQGISGGLDAPFNISTTYDPPIPENTIIFRPACYGTNNRGTYNPISPSSEIRSTLKIGKKRIIMRYNGNITGGKRIFTQSKTDFLKNRYQLSCQRWAAEPSNFKIFYKKEIKDINSAAKKIYGEYINAVNDSSSISLYNDLLDKLPAYQRGDLPKKSLAESLKKQLENLYKTRKQFRGESKIQARNIETYFQKEIRKILLSPPNKMCKEGKMHQGITKEIIKHCSNSYENSKSQNKCIRDRSCDYVCKLSGMLPNDSWFEENITPQKQTLKNSFSSFTRDYSQCTNSCRKNLPADVSGNDPALTPYKGDYCEISENGGSSFTPVTCSNNFFTSSIKLNLTKVKPKDISLSHRQFVYKRKSNGKFKLDQNGNKIKIGIRQFYAGTGKIGNTSNRVSLKGNTLTVHSLFPGQDGYCGGFHSPLMLFFNQKYPSFSSQSSILRKDIDGKLTAWPEADHYGFFLARLDNDSKKGEINNLNQLFGNSQHAGDGFDALSKYDLNLDNIIDKSDSVFKHLVLWKDKDGNGKSAKDELYTLSEMGIISIDLDYDHTYNQSFGNRAMAKGRSMFKYISKNGKEKQGFVLDIYFQNID